MPPKPLLPNPLRIRHVARLNERNTISLPKGFSSTSRRATATRPPAELRLVRNGNHDLLMTTTGSLLSVFDREPQFRVRTGAVALALTGAKCASLCRTCVRKNHYAPNHGFFDVPVAVGDAFASPLFDNQRKFQPVRTSLAEQILYPGL